MRVYWVCDKAKCKKKNWRTIPQGDIIVEDLCAFCEEYIMEPLTVEFKPKQKRKQRNDKPNK